MSALGNRSYLLREICGLADALGLLKMAAFVRGDDFESGADAEANSGDERIREANAVHVVSVGLPHRVADGLIAGEKTVEDARSDVGSGLDLGWSFDALGGWRRLDDIAEEPTAEPSRIDLIDGRVRLALERGGDRRQVGIVSKGEMLETLADAPGSWRGLPVELRFTESSDEGARGLIAGGEVGGEASGPGGRGDGLRSGHNRHDTAIVGWRTREVAIARVSRESEGKAQQPGMVVPLARAIVSGERPSGLGGVMRKARGDVDRGHRTLRERTRTGGLCTIEVCTIELTARSDGDWWRKRRPAAALQSQMRRGMLGKSSQTLTPQKCEPSVQMGVVTPARRWQGGPM
jgi:hypothetical protein